MLFRREPFLGQYAGKEPKWHIAIDGSPDALGVYAGLCGYGRPPSPGVEVRLGASVPAEELCYNCLREARTPSAPPARMPLIPYAEADAQKGWSRWFREIYDSEQSVTLMDAYLAGFRQGRTTDTGEKNRVHDLPRARGLGRADEDTP